MSKTKNTGVALITGSSRGIGAQTAELFASKGYAVCINYKSNRESALIIAKRIRENGGNVICVKADVSKTKEVERLFSTIDDKLGTLNILVNNAGILSTQTHLEDTNAERVNKILSTNVTSCFLCCQQAIKRMALKYGGTGGAIVNVSSRAAVTGSPGEYIDYAASKAAVDTLTIGLAKEVAREKIRVNGVRPGLIYTDIHSDGGEPDRVERLKTRIPMRRGGTSNEVAEAIYWLASNKSSFTTGTLIDVAGGL